jgi:hypothetical protein
MYTCYCMVFTRGHIHFIYDYSIHSMIGLSTFMNVFHECNKLHVHTYESQSIEHDHIVLFLTMVFSKERLTVTDHYNL